MEHQKSNPGSFFKGLLVGGIIAGVVGLLSAPHTGFETRRLVREKGEQIRDKTVETYENARSQADALLTDTRQQMDLLLTDTRQRANNIIQCVEEQLDTTTHKARS